MKTNLEITISNVAEAKQFLCILYTNGEAFHPEDSAEGVEWEDGSSPTKEEAAKLDALMQACYAIDGFDPCEVLMQLHDGEMDEAVDIYFINPLEFRGTIISMANNSFRDIYHTDIYKKLVENHTSVLALTWEDFHDLYYQPYLNGLCEPFVETTEEKYWDGLEVLPPKRWTQIEGGAKAFFFVGECYTADLFRCYVKLADKYYTALRPISASATSLLNLENNK